MNKYIIFGGNKLTGTITCQGSKNSVLPVLAAAILNSGKSKISNCPKITDVDVMLEILESFGCSIEYNDKELIIDSSNIEKYEINQNLMRKMRSSVILMGSMLAKQKKVLISYPGGCDLGRRPIDMHINSLRKLGAEITEERGYISCRAEKLIGSEIYFDLPSVGATENIMCAAVLAEGETYIRNAAREPEIIELQNFLNAMGANVTGAGTNVIKISGVKELHDVQYRIMPDRIVAGTYLCAAAITQGEIIIEDVRCDHMDSFLAKLREMGCNLELFSDRIKLCAPKRLKALQLIRTAPFPGFPTDMQQNFMSLLAVANGTSIVVETIFENRYRHIDELIRMGADIKVDERVAVIKGKNELYGAAVKATDLRGGAALILAGLAANGETIVEDDKHIERGYLKIEDKLRSLGAHITKI